MSVVLISIFAGCFFGQLYFYLFRFSKLIEIKPSQSLPNPPSPPVSLVICAHNEFDNLRILLPKLLSQIYPDFEIIVVNDRSTDGSQAFLQETSINYPRLKMLNIVKTPENFQSKKYALQTGIQSAKHEIILLTDADCLPNSEHWIRAMAGGFKEDTKIVLGFSQYFASKSLLNALIRYETLFTGIQYLSFALTGKPYMGVGRNLAYRRSFFLEKKGFTGYEQIIGGDDDLFVNKNASRNNTEIAIGPRALVWSYPKKNWKSWYSQKLRHLSVGKHYNRSIKTTLAILSLSHILFWFSFITLALRESKPEWILYGILIRTTIILITIAPISKILGDKIRIWNLALLDLLYVVYFIVIGIPALFSRKIKWI